jgi:hypothetical protein
MQPLTRALLVRKNGKLVATSWNSIRESCQEAGELEVLKFHHIRPRVCPLSQDRHVYKVFDIPFTINAGGHMSPIFMFLNSPVKLLQIVVKLP